VVRQVRKSSAVLVAITAAMAAAGVQKPAPREPDTVIRAGRLIDSVSTAPREGLSVLVAGAGADVALEGAIPGGPVKDITALHRVTFVLQGGRVCRRPADAAGRGTRGPEDRER
jgi:hypothetical protein